MAPLDWRAWARRTPALKRFALPRRFCTWSSRTSGSPTTMRKRSAVIAACIETSKIYSWRESIEALIFRRCRPHCLRGAEFHKSPGLPLLRQESRGHGKDHGTAAADGGVLLAHVQLGWLRCVRRRHVPAALAWRSARSGRGGSQTARGIRVPDPARPPVLLFSRRRRDGASAHDPRACLELS